MKTNRQWNINKALKKITSKSTYEGCLPTETRNLSRSRAARADKLWTVTAVSGKTSCITEDKREDWIWFIRS